MVDVVHALHGEHEARRQGEEVGGGIGDALSWVGNTLYDYVIKPLWHSELKPALEEEFPEFKEAEEIWDDVANEAHMLTGDNTISQHTNLIAGLIGETYDQGAAKADQVGDYTRDKSFDSDFLDVWRDPRTSHVVVSIRGSRDMTDYLIDDAMILTDGRPRDLISDDLRQVIDKYGSDNTLELGAHSLGASLAAETFRLNPRMEGAFERVNLFNPGSSPLAEENVVNSLIGKDNSYFYLNSVDPVSFGTTFGGQVIPSDHLVMNTPQGLNPITNHSIDQWTKQDESRFK